MTAETITPIALRSACRKPAATTLSATPSRTRPNFDLLHGVSFTKGCFVGQEVVARMQNKTVVRKRVVRSSGAAPLASGAEVKAGEAAIGKVGSMAGRPGPRHGAARSCR